MYPRVCIEGSQAMERRPTLVALFDIGRFWFPPVCNSYGFPKDYCLENLSPYTKGARGMTCSCPGVPDKPIIGEFVRCATERAY